MTPIEIIIHGNGATIRHPQEEGAAELFVASPETFGKDLVEFCVRTGISATSVIMYVSEELVFYKSFELPLKTPNLKEALEYQLGLLTPFSEDSYLYSYSTVRAKNEYKISLFAVQREQIAIYMQGVADAGFTIEGLFPESQRYVTRSAHKDKWALVLPGRFAKVYTFTGSRLQDRALCGTEPDFDEIVSLTGAAQVYWAGPSPGEQRYRDAGVLLAGKPVLKEFNLLPATYRRPDYFKTIIPVLAALNILCLVGIVGLKITNLYTLDRQVSEQIEKIMPAVKEVKQLQSREQELKAAIGNFEKLGENPDLISFLKELTDKLPSGSYLDQMQLDKREGAIQLRGYTEDVSALTAKLKALGEIKLKSTSRRRNQTYFNVEITPQ